MPLNPLKIVSKICQFPDRYRLFVARSHCNIVTHNATFIRSVQLNIQKILFCSVDNSFNEMQNTATERSFSRRSLEGTVAAIPKIQKLLFLKRSATRQGNKSFFRLEFQMEAMITVSPSRIGDETVNAVNARDLHEFLEVKTPFRDWISRRISDYGFTEEKDFRAFLRETSGGRPSQEYAISLDMAKELAMVERNEKGKQARQYFIECERRANSRPHVGLPDFRNPAIAARAWAEQHERADQNAVALQETQHRLTAAEPKLLAFDTIATCQNGSMCITNSAKALQVQPKALFGWLQEHQWIYRRAGGKVWIGYQNRIQSGHLEHKVTTVERSDGSEKVIEQVLITPKGLTRLAELLTSLRSLESASLN